MPSRNPSKPAVRRKVPFLEAYFENIVELSEDAIISVRADQRIRLFNQGAEAIFGYTEAEALGQRLDLLLPDRFRGAHREHVAGFAASGERLRPMTTRETIFGRRKDGSEFPAEATITQFMVQGETVLTVRLRDITEHIQAAEARARLAAIVDSSEDAIYSVGLDARITSWNPAAERLYGYPAAAVLGQVVTVLAPPERQTEEAWVLARIRQGEAFDHFETERVRAGGQRLAVSLTVSPVKDGHGRIIGASKIARDITERKQAEEALRVSERRLKADLDAMTRLQQLGTLFVRAGNLEAVLGTIVEAAMALSGAAFGNIQLLGPDGDLHIAAQRGFPQWWVEFWERVAKGRGTCGTALQRGERVVVPDVEASPIFVGTPALDIQRRAGVRAVQSTPLVSRSGQPLGMFSTHYTVPHCPDDRVLRLLDLLARQATDIIERAHSEEALRESHATLERRVSERTAALRATVEDLEAEIQKRTAAEEELRRLSVELTLTEQRERQRLAQVLHDGLQQLLVAAQFRTAFLARLPDATAQEHTGKVRELLAEAVAASRSLTAELSPPVLQSGGLTPALKWLAQWMQDTHGLRVDLQVQTTQPPEAEALSVLLFQAVRELLFNVVKHAGVRDAGVVVARAHDHIQVVVTDRGQGFDPAHVPLATTGGVGLASIRQRLEYLGGNFEVSSAPGQGSRITLSVPLQSP